MLYEILHVPLYQYYAFAVLVFVPVVRIFERAGFRAWWTLLLAVPMVGFICCAGVMALARWPVLRIESKSGKD